MAPVLIYVQHLMGAGHLQRAALLAREMARGGLAVTLVSGGFPVPGLDAQGLAAEGVELIQLPPARAADETFRVVLDEAGMPVDDGWRGRRRALLQTAAERVEPGVVVIEMFPFGRRHFRFELVPLLERMVARPRRPWVVCSVRDILVEASSPGRYEEMAALAERFFDRVLVHGDPALIPFERTFPHAARLAGSLYHTGYVVGHAGDAAHVPPPAGRGGEVLVSAGSRGMGEPLLAAAIGARALTPLAHVPWRLLAGLNAPEERLRELRRSLPPGVAIERFRPDFVRLLAGASLCISQGGYNTTAEVLAAGVPAVIVPHSGAGDREQAIRARLLEERGLVTMLPEGEPLTPESLARAIGRATERAPARAAGPSGAARQQAGSGASLRMEGARKTAAIVADLAGRPWKRQRA